MSRSTTEKIKQQQLGLHLGLCVTTDAGQSLIITGTTKLYPEQIWDLALSRCHLYLQRFIEMQSKIILDKRAYPESPWDCFYGFLSLGFIACFFWNSTNFHTGMKPLKCGPKPTQRKSVWVKTWVLRAEPAPLSTNTIIPWIKLQQSAILAGKVKQLTLPQFCF